MIWTKLILRSWWVSGLKNWPCAILKGEEENVGNSKKQIVTH